MKTASTNGEKLPSGTARWPGAELHARSLVDEVGARVVSHGGALLRRWFGPLHDDRFGILMYHRIADRVAGIPQPTINVTPARFRAQLQELLDCGYVVWPLAKVLEFHANGWPIMPWVTVITFDDGFEGVFTQAWPVLCELRLPATVFLATAYLDSDQPFPFDHWGQRHAGQVPAESYRPLSAEQCREMAAGGLIEFGAHTHTHQDFRGRPADFACDLRTNLETLTRLFGRRQYPFAFPYGTPRLGFASEDLAGEARRAGFACGLTTESGLIEAGRDRFQWGRMNVFPWDSGWSLAARLSGWYDWAPRLKRRLTVGLGRTGGGRSEAVPAAGERQPVLSAPAPAPLAVPTISVIVPTLNRAAWLREALGSLTSQQTNGEFSFDIHVVDNASTDATRCVVEEVAASSAVPVHYHYQQKPGDAATRNCGVAAAGGEWLAFFDDDQLAEPRWLAELLAAASRSQAPIVGGAVLLDLDESQLARLGPICRRLLRETQLYRQPQAYHPRHLPGTGNALVARSVFDALGAFDETMVGGGSDFDFFSRARAAGLLLWYTPQAVIRHRVAPSRLAPEYLRWDSLSGGAEHAAYFDYQQRGLAMLLLLGGARLGQALFVHLPLLAWAWILRDEGGVLGRRAMLWRTEGYLRRLLAIVAPGWFSQPRFFESLNLRHGRSLCS